MGHGYRRMTPANATMSIRCPEEPQPPQVCANPIRPVIDSNSYIAQQVTSQPGYADIERGASMPGFPAPQEAMITPVPAAPAPTRGFEPRLADPETCGEANAPGPQNTETNSLMRSLQSRGEALVTANTTTWTQFLPLQVQEAAEHVFLDADDSLAWAEGAAAVAEGVTALLPTPYKIVGKWLAKPIITGAAQRNAEAARAAVVAAARSGAQEAVATTIATARAEVCGWIQDNVGAPVPSGQNVSREAYLESRLRAFINGRHGPVTADDGRTGQMVEQIMARCHARRQRSVTVLPDPNAPTVPGLEPRLMGTVPANASSVLGQAAAETEAMRARADEQRAEQVRATTGFEQTDLEDTANRLRSRQGGIRVLPNAADRRRGAELFGR